MAVDRERCWMGHVLSDTDVTVRHYAVLQHGEELTENPPTEVMTLAQWKLRHLEYDCDIDGMPLHPRPGVGLPVDPVEP